MKVAHTQVLLHFQSTWSNVCTAQNCPIAQSHWWQEKKSSCWCCKLSVVWKFGDIPAFCTYCTLILCVVFGVTQGPRCTQLSISYKLFMNLVTNVNNLNHWQMSAAALGQLLQCVIATVPWPRPSHGPDYGLSSFREVLDPDIHNCTSTRCGPTCHIKCRQETTRQYHLCFKRHSALESDIDSFVTFQRYQSSAFSIASIPGRNTNMCKHLWSVPHRCHQGTGHKACPRSSPASVLH